MPSCFAPAAGLRGRCDGTCCWSCPPGTSTSTAAPAAARRWAARTTTTAASIATFCCAPDHRNPWRVKQNGCYGRGKPATIAPTRPASTAAPSPPRARSGSRSLGLRGFFEECGNTIGREPPALRSTFTGASGIGSRALTMLLMDDRITSPLGCSPEDGDHFARRCAIPPRKLPNGNALELSEAEDGRGVLSQQPRVGGRVVVRILDERLGEAPTAVLAGCDGGLQELVLAGGDDVISRLIGAALN